jgi:hypothetical protein
MQKLTVQIEEYVSGSNRPGPRGAGGAVAPGPWTQRGPNSCLFVWFTRKENDAIRFFMGWNSLSALSLHLAHFTCQLSLGLFLCI